MTTSEISDLLGASTILGMGLVGLFFLRYWKSTRDRLFLILAVSFWLLAANRFALLFSADGEDRSWFYAVRLGAFVLILVGVWLKNRDPARAP